MQLSKMDDKDLNIDFCPIYRETGDSDEPTIWQKLAQLGRDVESLPCDLPTDLAANHDHYLHGLSKRQ